MPQFVDREGNLLASDAHALVNTVNTVGIMGKGIALEFKRNYPENFKAYKRACAKEQVRPGEMFVFDNSLEMPVARGQVQTASGGQRTLWASDNPNEPHTLPRRWIINFPTKRHWRSCSRMSDIIAGLIDLRKWINELHTESHLTSIALPRLGCANGGLSWSDVRPHIEERLSDLSRDIAVYLFSFETTARDKGVDAA